MRRDYRIPDDFRMYGYVSQLLQADGIKTAIDAHRRAKPACMGTLYWQLNDSWPVVSWSSRDYYGKKKLAFDWLQRSYQPLLPSLHFEKRRWNPGSDFKACVWIVNDYHRRFAGHTLEWHVSYDGEATATAGSLGVHIDADSAEQFASIDWTLPSTAAGNFEIAVAIKDPDGEVVADNHYTLLVGDQESAKAQSLKFLDEAMERLDRHGHSVYRYWPEMWEESE